VFLNGKIVSSIRLHILSETLRALRHAEAFSDILDPMIAAGMVLVDGARFVVDPSIGSARLSIAWQTLKICLRVADEIDADYGVAAVQPSHVKLYQKIYNFAQLAEPRPYCQLNGSSR
jgi:hypothetical protein